MQAESASPQKATVTGLPSLPECLENIGLRSDVRLSDQRPRLQQARANQADLIRSRDPPPPLRRYSAAALWNLAFNERCRKAIASTPGVVEALRELLRTSESGRTREAAKGALWTLGLQEDVDSLFEAGRFAGGAGVVKEEHIMLSYEWGSQQKVREMRGGVMW